MRRIPAGARPTSVRILPAVWLVPVALVTSIAAQPEPQGTQDPPSTPSMPEAGRATVLVRAIRELDEFSDEVFDPQRRERTRVSAEGAGFFVTPYGHLVTTWDLLIGRKSSARMQRGDARVDGAPDPPSRLEVLWAGPDGTELAELTVKAVAASEELNLALLSAEVRGEVPVVPLGDSDEGDSKDRLTVLTFARPPSPRTTPRPPPDMTRLPVPPPGPTAEVAAPTDSRPIARIVASAASRDTSGNGNPVLDADGYAVGVAQGRAPAAGSVDRTIPINVVKDFLEANGLAGLLPPRLDVGSVEAFDDKGIALAVVSGLADAWPGRTRWESPQNGIGLSLRIDRCVSPLGLQELEARMLAGELGGLAAQAKPVSERGGPAKRGPGPAPRPQGPVSGASVRGSASAHVQDVPYGVEYVLLDLGEEKVVARYTGPMDVMAYNRGVLRRSLASLEARRLLEAARITPLVATFGEVALGAPPTPAVRMPATWTREPWAEPVPASLPLPDAALSSSPVGDLTTSLRAFWWHAAPMEPTAAAHAAAPERGRWSSVPDATYVWRNEVLGVPWVAAGEFFQVGSGLLLLELRAPAARVAIADPVFTEWMQQASPARQ